MIDLHCHVLPGIDDGPATAADAFALAAAARTAGTTVLIATPHVSWEYPNRSAAIASLVEALNERLRGTGVPLEVRTGAEIAMTMLGDIAPEELSSLTLAGGRWLLVEPPFTPVISGLEAIVAQLERRGFGVVLAHPERCRGFQRDPGMLAALVARGALISITAGSLNGRFGELVRRFSYELLRDGLVHNVASDAHDLARRPPALAGELERAGLGPLADWLARGGSRGDHDRGADSAATGRGRAGGAETRTWPAPAPGLTRRFATGHGGARGSRSSRR